MTITPASLPVSLYVHIPFCRVRCSYCVFNTYTGLSDLIPAYVAALCREIQWLGDVGQTPAVHTVYFGGGTPSVLTVEQVAQILAAVDGAFTLTADPEITLEANPTHNDLAYFRALRSAGVNRLSFGAQSAQQGDLRLFNRRHAWQDVPRYVGIVRAAGFEQISLDFIYGAPGQTMHGWQDTVRQAVALDVPHISAYSMGLEPGSPLTGWVESGKLAELDPDRVADMYDWASDYFVAHGLQQYEISNWAKPGAECAHNLQYWRRWSYLGVGAGAFGFIEPIRYHNIKKPGAYVAALSAESLSMWSRAYPLSPAVDLESVEHLNEAEARSETMILGLRLLQQGIKKAAFEALFHGPPEAYYARELRELSTAGLLNVTTERITLTQQARLIGNRVFTYFV